MGGDVKENDAATVLAEVDSLIDELETRIRRLKRLRLENMSDSENPFLFDIFSIRVLHALNQQGVYQLSGLVEWLGTPSGYSQYTGESKLRNTRNIGVTAIEEIRQVLSDYGIRL